MLFLLGSIVIAPSAAHSWSRTYIIQYYNHCYYYYYLKVFIITHRVNLGAPGVGTDPIKLASRPFSHCGTQQLSEIKSAANSKSDTLTHILIAKNENQIFLMQVPCFVLIHKQNNRLQKQTFFTKIATPCLSWGRIKSIWANHDSLSKDILLNGFIGLTLTLALSCLSSLSTISSN